jgi:subtilisin family serine protease
MIQQAFEEAGRPVGISPSDDRPEDMDYMYERGVVLARDEDADRVQRALGLDPTWDKTQMHPEVDRSSDDVQADYEPVAPLSVSGLSRVSLPSPPTQHDFPDDTLFWLDRLDRTLGVGVAVPNHVVHISGTGGGCPANEPLPSAGGPQPSMNQDPDASGRGVKVVVIDSGIIAQVRDEHPWLAGVTGEAEPAGVRHYRDHGTFIAGVLRTMAPSAEVDVKAFYDIDGATLEDDLAVRLERALEETPDIISMSAGTTTRVGGPLLALQNFWERRLSKVKGTVLVAAAGNDGGRGPFYPAAFPWCISVGALDEDGARAPYSNFGSWVDVYARGSRVVNAYPRGWYQYEQAPFTGEWTNFVVGMASWDGTSFATPLVSGLIAARMSWSGESARVAADALLALAHERARAEVGAVLEPGMASKPAERT